MPSIDALTKFGLCPNDGSRLKGKLGFCPLCRSMWTPIFDGTAGGDHRMFAGGGDDGRDYIRRKVKELEHHRLKPHVAPPLATSNLQGGHGLAPSGALVRAGQATHAEWQASLSVPRRIVDGRARIEASRLGV